MTNWSPLLRRCSLLNPARRHIPFLHRPAPLGRMAELRGVPHGTSGATHRGLLGMALHLARRPATRGSAPSGGHVKLRKFHAPRGDGLESAFADDYAGEQWQSIAEHLSEHVQNGLARTLASRSRRLRAGRRRAIRRSAHGRWRKCDRRTRSRRSPCARPCTLSGCAFGSTAPSFPARRTWSSRDGRPPSSFTDVFGTSTIASGPGCRRRTRTIGRRSSNETRSGIRRPDGS